MPLCTTPYTYDALPTTTTWTYDKPIAGCSDVVEYEFMDGGFVEFMDGAEFEFN